MKIVSIMWSSYANMLVRAAGNLAGILEVSAYSSRVLEEDPEKVDAVLKEAADADIIFLYRSSEGFWEIIEEQMKELGKNIPVVCCGYDPSYWTLSTVRPEIVAEVNSYVVINGEENFVNMLRYIAREAGGLDIEARRPKPVPWEGLYHPEAPVGHFPAVDEYLKWYEEYREQGPVAVGRRSTVGILFTRHQWVNENLEVEDALIAFLRAQERAEFLAESAAAAIRSLDLAVLQYREGITDFTTVLTAQQALLQQQDNLARTMGHISSNLVGVYRALGGGWQLRQGRDFVPTATKEVMAKRTNWGRLLTPVDYVPSPPD